MKKQLWVEKYRPSSLSELYGHENINDAIQTIISSNQHMHYLFYGLSGTGKTSMAHIMCKQIYPSDKSKYILKLNASYDQSIDIIHTKIRPFCQKTVTPFEYNGQIIDYKFIILDEADTLTQDAQNALRRCIEIYSYNTRFCFICNYVSKIISPIISRCVSFHFKPLSADVCLKKMTEVCLLENITSDTNTLQYIYIKHKGDLRACLTTLQGIYSMFELHDKTLTMTHCQQYYNEFIEENIFKNLNRKTTQNILYKCLNSGMSTKQIILQLISFVLNKKKDSQKITEIMIKFSKAEKYSLHCKNNATLIEWIITEVASL